MGADTTTSHLIFFIAATTIAVSASAVLAGVVTDLSGKMDAKGDALGDQIATDITIANDPANVPNNPLVIYVKNTGQSKLDGALATLILDGAAVSSTNEIVGGTAGVTTWRSGDVLKMEHSATLASGDHQVRVVTQNGVHDDMKFRV